jgi:hypothetical protein
MDLQEFINENLTKQADDLIFKKAGIDQAIFVRDDIHRLFARGKDGNERYAWRKAHPVKVVSTHTSKSVELPVYEINPSEDDENDLIVIIRDNFFDWKVSVSSRQPVEDNFYGLFDSEESLYGVYCEGFKEEWVFGSYAESHHDFTIELYSGHALWTFIYLLTAQRKRDAT